MGRARWEGKGKGAMGGRGRGHKGRVQWEGAMGGRGRGHNGKVIAGWEGDGNRALHHKMKAKGKATMCRIKKSSAEEERT